MNYAIILAGGIGSRFWPLSNDLEPKQFLNIYSNRSMIEETINRISPFIKRENIYITTNKLHNKKIKDCLKNSKVLLKNIIFEPCVRNTLAPIAFLCNRINSIDPEAVVVVLPCDHIIKQKDKFLKLLSKALDVAKQGYIAIFGIIPKRPETGYGYIKIRAKNKNSAKSDGFDVDRFIEKPNLKKAKKLLKDKRYYWNSGIFIFRADTILKEIRRLTPDIYKIIIKMKDKKDFIQLWHRLPSVSIDYAIMEKTKRMVLLQADYGWLDIGSWQAIEDVFKKDKYGNIFRGNCIDIGSRNSIIWSNKRTLATLGLKDIIIVDTEDALLVCSKNSSQDVKKLVQILKRKAPKK